MSIQIITNFNSTSKVCYVKDEKHGEAYIEGRGSDILDSAAEIAAQIIYKVALSQADEGFPDNYNDNGKLSPLDAWTAELTSAMTKAITTKLIKIKIEQEIGIDNIPELMVKALIEKAEKEMSDEKRADEDNE